jgi:hypothetical protein
MVNLTMLAPDIVAAFLDETVRPEVTMFGRSAVMPVLWERQRGRVVEKSWSDGPRSSESR